MVLFNSLKQNGGSDQRRFKETAATLESVHNMNFSADRLVTVVFEQPPNGIFQTWLGGHAVSHARPNHGKTPKSFALQ